MNLLTKSVILLTATMTTVVMTGCDNSSSNNSHVEPVEINRVDISSPGLYPEGIEYDSRDDIFYLSSMTQGSISKVDIDGNIVNFIEDDNLISTVGVHLDEATNRLIVANADGGVSTKSSDNTIGKTASIGIYDATTGANIDHIDLAELDPEQGHFANDLTMDDLGNIYVTDSFSPYIYKVDTNGQASIFATSALFEVPAGGFGLNGIVYHPQGYLIVAHYANGELFRVSIDDPTHIETIITDESISYLDGLLLKDEDTLVVVSNDLSLTANQVTELTSDDEWFTAQVINSVETLDQAATTVTMRNDSVYAIYSPLSILFGVTGTDPERTLDDFYINRIDFQ